MQGYSYIFGLTDRVRTDILLAGFKGINIGAVHAYRYILIRQAPLGY